MEARTGFLMAGGVGSCDPLNSLLHDETPALLEMTPLILRACSSARLKCELNLVLQTGKTKEVSLIIGGQ